MTGPGNGSAPAGEARGAMRTGLSAGQQFHAITSPVQTLLSRLERVRRAGNGYSARCPAHQDRSSSLSVTEGSDGRVLVHCFAGCPVHVVAAAVGMTVSDLFPPRASSDRPEDRRRFRELAKQGQWAVALNVLAFEATVVLIACRTALRGATLSAADSERLEVAIDRIDRCREVLNGR